MERPSLRYGGPSPRMRALASQDKLTRRNWLSSFGVSSRSEPIPALAARPSLIGLAPAGSASSIFRGMVSSRLQAHPARHLGASRTELPMGKNTLGGLGERKFSGGGARADPNGRRWP